MNSTQERFEKAKNLHLMGHYKDAQKILREYSWPGNVRELENVLQRAIVLCEKNIIEDKDIMIDVSKQSNFYNNIQENLSEKKLMQA